MIKKSFLALCFVVSAFVSGRGLATNLGLRYHGSAQVVLVFGGKTGWIGQRIVKILKEMGHNPVCATSRLEDRSSIINEIDLIQPDAIINAAGVTGRPNIDWCEDHKPETIRANVIGALNLVDVAYLRNLHVTHLGTGCLYTFDDAHPKGSGKGFTEMDAPNHETSFYCFSKIRLESLLLTYPNVLHLRVRMPLSSEKHPRNFITKITGYKKVINEPNSISVLEDLLPVAIDMTLRGLKGNYNFVNPGVITHNEILDLYKTYVDPEFSYTNFSVDEQNKILKATRSNCELDATKLLSEYPHIPSIRESVIKALVCMCKTVSDI